MSEATVHADSGFEERYQAARAAMRAMQSRALRSVDRAAWDEAARGLNLARSNWRAELNEITSVILADHALFGVLRRGRSLFQFAMERESIDEDSLEGRLAAAAKRIRYRVLRVRGPADGVRIPMRDVLREQDFLIADMQMSKVCEEGMLLAGRTVPFEDCAFFTGAGIPVMGQAGQVLSEKLNDHGLFARCKASVGRPLSAAEEADLATICIRTLLTMRADQWIRYADRQEQPDAQVAMQSGENSPPA